MQAGLYVWCYVCGTVRIVLCVQLYICGAVHAALYVWHCVCVYAVLCRLRKFFCAAGTYAYASGVFVGVWCGRTCLCLQRISMCRGHALLYWYCMYSMYCILCVGFCVCIVLRVSRCVCAERAKY